MYCFEFLAGKLRAEVRDGSGKVMDAAEVESLGYGKYRIIFNPQIAGKFNIYLYWADIAVESAFPIHIIAETEQPSTSRVMPLSDEIDHRSRSRSRFAYADDIRNFAMIWHPVNIHFTLLASVMKMDKMTIKELLLVETV